MGVTVLGSINMDVVLRVPRITQPGETLSASAKNLYSGGKGANQAIAVARMQVPSLLIGAVGDDEFGTILKTGFEREGIDISALQTLTDSDTGQAYICVSDEGENAIVVVPGANHDYRFSETHMARPETRSVYLSQFEMPADQIRAFMKAARGGTRMINAAPAIAENRTLLDEVEIIVVNETELSIFTGAPVDESTPAREIENAARKLVGRDDQWVIVTLGKKGALAVSAGQSIFVAGHEMEVVDTTGAGDCFCGTLAAMLSEGAEMADALAHANAAAALAVTKPGAGPSMPDRFQVKALLEKS